MKVLDLFAGIGGFSLALENLGMETVAFCEIDKDCQNILEKNFPSTTIFSDITNLSTVHIYDGENYLYEVDEEGKTIKDKHFSEIDIITAGYPCVGHSVAGKKEGFKNEESNLWRHLLRLVKEIRPQYVIVENSPNLRNTGLAELLKAFDSLFYSCEGQIISAFAVGSPHKRERLYLVFWRQDISYPDPFRLWRATASEEKESFGWPKAASRFRKLFKKITRFKSAVCRMSNGLSKRLHPSEKIRRERIKQLGNAIVPQIPELIGLALMKK